MELPVHLISYLPSDCFSNIVLLLGSYPSGLKSVLRTKRLKLQSVDFSAIAAAGFSDRFRILKSLDRGEVGFSKQSMFLVSASGSEIACL